MEKKCFAFCLTVGLAQCTLAPANVLQKEDVQELTAAIKENTEYVFAGHNELSQSLYRAIQDSGVKDAARSVPEILKRIEVGEIERSSNKQKIEYLEKVLPSQEKKIQILEEARVEQQEILGNIKSGLAISLDHVNRSNKNWEQAKGALWAVFAFIVGRYIFIFLRRKRLDAYLLKKKKREEK